MKTKNELQIEEQIKEISINIADLMFMVLDNDEVCSTIDFSYNED